MIIDYSPFSNIFYLDSLANRKRILDEYFLRGLLYNTIVSPAFLSLINFKVPKYSTHTHNISFYISQSQRNYIILNKKRTIEVFNVYRQ